jgi:fatty acid desaturase
VYTTSTYFILAGNPLLVPGTLPHVRANTADHYYEPEKLRPASFRRAKMLWTITIILFILWVVGLVSSYTLGGWIHILLVLAIIVLIFNLMSGRRVV